MQVTLDQPRDASQEVVVPADGLRELLVKMLVKKGMFAAEAGIAADRLLEADLRGIHSHGSRFIGRYLKAMDAGDIDPRAQILVERETAATAVLNGGAGIGHVAATKGMQTALAKARDVGVGVVTVKRGQHYGAAGVYALLATDAGAIGYTTTSTGPATVAAYGSREPGTANNAFAWGIPVREGAPVILDAACAESSWGKIETLKLYGGELPAGWALDENGVPTTDPSAAKTLLPFAGARGYGLAFVSSILASLLVGARAPIHKSWSVEMDCSEHFFLAIDIEKFIDPARFHKELDATLTDMRALAPAAGFDTVRLPGELEWERSELWRASGIPIHRDHAEKLTGIAGKLKLEVPW